MESPILKLLGLISLRKSKKKSLLKFIAESKILNYGNIQENIWTQRLEIFLSQTLIQEVLTTKYREL